MFLYLLLTLFVFIICYVLPLVGTLLSHENPQKWVAYWLVQLVSGFVLIPLLGQLFEVEIQLVVKILLSLALIVLLNQEKVNSLVNIGIRHALWSRNHGHESIRAQESCHLACRSRSQGLWTHWLICWYPFKVLNIERIKNNWCPCRKSLALYPFQPSSFASNQKSEAFWANNCHNPKSYQYTLYFESFLACFSKYPDPSNQLWISSTLNF